MITIFPFPLTSSGLLIIKTREITCPAGIAVAGKPDDTSGRNQNDQPVE